MNSPAELSRSYDGSFPVPWNHWLDNRMDLSVFEAGEARVYLASPDPALLETVLASFAVMNKAVVEANTHGHHAPIAAISTRSNRVLEVAESPLAWPSSHARYAISVDHVPSEVVELGSRGYAYITNKQARTSGLGAYLEYMRALHDMGYSVRGVTSAGIGYSSISGEVWMIDPHAIEPMGETTQSLKPTQLWDFETADNERFAQIVHDFLGNTSLEQLIRRADTVDEAIAFTENLQ